MPKITPLALAHTVATEKLRPYGVRLSDCDVTLYPVNASPRDVSVDLALAPEDQNVVILIENGTDATHYASYEEVIKQRTRPGRFIFLIKNVPRGAYAESMQLASLPPKKHRKRNRKVKKKRTLKEVKLYHDC